MMSASGEVGVRVWGPLDCCKCVIVGGFRESEFPGWVRALRMSWTARNRGRRSLTMLRLQAS